MDQSSAAFDHNTIIWYEAARLAKVQQLWALFQSAALLGGVDTMGKCHLREHRCVGIIMISLGLQFLDSYIIRQDGRAWVAQSWIDFQAPAEMSHPIAEWLSSFSHFVYVQTGGAEVHVGFQGW